MAEAPPTLRRDDLYVRNMIALFRSDVQLAQRLDELEDDGRLEVETCRRGGVTAAVSPGQGKPPVYLHSKIDPAAEAQRFAGNIDISEAFCFVVSGFGLGHHLLALQQRLRGDALIIVVEPDLQLIKTALETVDLSELFAGDRCVILTDTDKGAIQQRLDPHNTLMMIGTKFVSHPASERMAGAFHAEMRNLLTEHMRFCRMSIVTLVTNSRVTCRNIAKNLPLYLASPPIDVLRDRFAGYPAVVVSAGPSLHRNIDQLVDLKGRAVLCAVQTTFKPLLERGITPDFVTSLDYHEMSRRFFEGASDFAGTHLVAEPKAHWTVLDAYEGPASILDNSFARMCVGDELGSRGGLKAGATVAHLAFYLAMHIGCDPIIMVGQDLGFTDHVFYTPGVAMQEMRRPEFNRFYTVEMSEWERIVRNRKVLHKATDIHGYTIYTDDLLHTYLQQFEGDFSGVPGRVIDATEGGVRKAGARVMTLADAASRFCSRLIPEDRFAYRESVNWNDTAKLSAGAEQVRRRLDELWHIEKTCHDMLEVLDEMTDLVENPNEFNKRFARVDALRLEVRRYERIYHTISMVSQQAELQRFSADRRLAQDELDDTTRAQRQLQRDMAFVKAFIEGASVLREILSGGLERLEEALERQPASANT